MDLLEKGRRRSGFTFAPEAATDRLRDIINKPIADDDLLHTAEEVYRRGWKTIKMYFMIGHPTQTLEDVQAIADLSKQVLAVGRRCPGRQSQCAHRRQHACAQTAYPIPMGANGGGSDHPPADLCLLKQELIGAGHPLYMRTIQPKHSVEAFLITRRPQRCAMSSSVLGNWARSWTPGASISASINLAEGLCRLRLGDGLVRPPSTHLGRSAALGAHFSRAEEGVPGAGVSAHIRRRGCG